MLWVDKHRPKTLKQLDHHEHLTEQLTQLVEAQDLPHLLFFGPAGAGKKTRVMALLRELYGSGVTKLKVETLEFKLPSGKSKEVSSVSSAYHIELNPSDAGSHDRIVVQEIIKRIAQSQPLEQTKHPFKVVLLNEVDRLSREAQHALRRTMEKYMPVCRLILCCNSVTKVLDPLRSRCLPIRVSAPSVDEAKGILLKIAKKESFVLPDILAIRIARESRRNLRRAILLLESTKAASYPLKAGQKLALPDWEQYAVQVARDMIAEQSPKQLLKVRNKLFELLGHCIPADIIMKALTTELLKKSPDNALSHEIVRWAAHYEARIHKGQKEIFHLEAFVARYMTLHKQFLFRAVQ